ncbi:MAG: LacI family DNA-binding transcriptional regulator, partial [Planctomycetota bacterium]
MQLSEKAGVSIAAVSATLNSKTGKIGVGADKQAKIQKVARELGYRPNTIAASLRTGRTYNIGICLPRAEEYLAHPQGAYNFWRICEVAGKSKYRVSIINASNID